MNFFFNCSILGLTSREVLHDPIGRHEHAEQNALFSQRNEPKVVEAKDKLLAKFHTKVENAKITSELGPDGKLFFALLCPVRKI